MSELRKRGISTAVVCSTPFMTLGRTQARTFGVPDLPLIEIPHPFGCLNNDEVRQRAEGILPQLMQLIKERIQ